MSDTDDAVPDAEMIRRRVQRDVLAAARRERLKQAQSLAALLATTRGVNTTTSTSPGMVLHWSKHARDALPKRPGGKKASDTDD